MPTRRRNRLTTGVGGGRRHTKIDQTLVVLPRRSGHTGSFGSSFSLFSFSLFLFFSFSLFLGCSRRNRYQPGWLPVLIPSLDRMRRTITGSSQSPEALVSYILASLDSVMQRRRQGVAMAFFGFCIHRPAPNDLTLPTPPRHLCDARVTLAVMEAGWRPFVLAH